MFYKLLTVLVSIPVVYLAIALGLILSQPPIDQNKLGGTHAEGLDFSGTEGQDLTNLADLESLEVPNASPIQYRYYPAREHNKNLIILIHGSGWHSMQYAQMAHELASSNQAHVITPDLRGHGFNPERRGDVDYIGQMEDDIAHLANHFAKKLGTQKLIIGGHSSGGGLVIRFAGGRHGKMADGWLLLAPYISYSAPTAREHSGGWAYPLTRRFIGLAMLNNVGISWLNDIIAIQFNMPEHVRNAKYGDTATLAYTFRLNTSYAPRQNYQDDLAAMSKPLLLIAGKNDEAFIAKAYEPTLAPHVKDGEYELLDEPGHVGVVSDPKTILRIKRWLEERF